MIVTSQQRSDNRTFLDRRPDNINLESFLILLNEFLWCIWWNNRDIVKYAG
jgi:hypothetical protein